ncbi:hypothetical protein BD779DRAFT_1668753 [Infundibulicybe gibba]|nr:hypothetical protein BD779DRAFT_1668753 [Infundibulicybe gibba]
MSSTAQTEERDAQLLHIGKQCSHSSCLLVDFLPFKCQHCELAFCQEHFMVSAHQCQRYDETKYNRVAPDCPFCKVPVAFRPGQDPNIRMEEHFHNECTTLTGGTSKPKSSPVCAKGNCKKVLFAPISCDKCRKQFCPAHRFPGDHTCLSPTTTSSTRMDKVPSSNLPNIDVKNLNARASAAGVATVDAIRKTLTSIPASPATNSHKAPSKPEAASSTIFSKTSRPSLIPHISSSNSDVNHCHNEPATNTITLGDVPPNTVTSPIPIITWSSRAKAEQESRRKAMEGRAKKGLLTEEEKAILAAEQARKKEKGDCIIM